ncbi:MAG TPA: aminotransferase class I/II-fold pyridoxal phosphate-dependent enzyme [Acidimicrobiales bacterium]|nr:aminotransferase class I/II-fold pyridoxal phosphate-dependent enzyme [Acidimicrobiales bacterium]
MTNPMFVHDERLASLIFDYCRDRLSLDPVPLDYGGTRESFEPLLAGLLGPDGGDPARILDLFAEHLATAVISCDSPRFMSFIPAAPTKAALLFDMVVSCSSLQGTSWLEAAGAVAAENQALRLIADLAGFPADAGGCFVSGGSIGNLSALVVARDTASRRRGRPVQRPFMAVSEEVHASVSNALRIMGVEPVVVPSDDHRLTGDALAAALDGTDNADDVVAVVATAGTTNAGLVDDLAGVARVCHDRRLWLHVDAAYGGAAMLSPAARPLFDGIEHADSFIVDPHKWLFAPFDCAALLYRDPALARSVHAQQASYLDVIHDPQSAAWNPSDYAIHLTRRARGLPLWFSLAVHGTEAYRQAVESVLVLARRAAELVRASPFCELVRDPDLSIVLFRRTGWDRAAYDAWSQRLLASQVGFVTPTTWEGSPAARLALLHPSTTIDMVEEILATMA